jgi:Ca-activated chloride channel family protein
VNQASSIFADPWVLSLLLAMPALSLTAVAAAWRSRRLLARFGQPIALIGLLPQPPRFRWLSGLCFSLAMTALIVGAAGPHWGRDPQPQVVAGRDLVVLLDMSGSMRAKDAPPDRFTRSVSAVRDLLNYVRTRGGHRLGLVVFAADAQVVVPLTYDYDHFELKLDGLSMEHPPAGLRPKPSTKSGTRIGAGLQTAVASQDPNMKGFQDVLLLSDGDDPLGNDEWQAGLKAIENAGVPVYTVGVGDPKVGGKIAVAGREQDVVTRLNEYPMQEIARRTAGSYLPAHVERPQLAEFFRQRIESKGTSTPQGDTPPLPQSRQVWFYAAALGLFGLLGLMQLRRTDLPPLARWRRKPTKASEPITIRVAVAAAVMLMLLAAAPPVAEEFERQANAAFAAGRFDEAVRLYTKAEERTSEPGRVAYNAGVAYFNLGRYREAERLFRCALDSHDESRRARALYNLGTCLLFSSEGRDATRLAEAIRCFDQCVDLGEDARHNLELAKQLWRQIRSDSPPPESDPQSPNDPNRPDDPTKPDDNDPGKGPDGAGRQGRGQPMPVPGSADGAKPTPTDANPGPGAGSPSPLTKDEESKPLPRDEALRLLHSAEDRITRERRALQRGAADEVRGYPDW